jgi:hypothetical protein
MNVGHRLMISYAVMLLFLAAVLLVTVNRLGRQTQATHDLSRAPKPAPKFRGWRPAVATWCRAMASPNRCRCPT